MKKHFYYILLLLFVCLHTTTAQTCEEMLKAAKAEERKGEYFKAYQKYEAALINCGENRKAEIKKLKDNAILALQNLKNEAVTQKENAVKSEKKAQEAQKVSENALVKTNTLISYFGFSEELAWAYKNGYFAVVNDEGQRLTDFVYKEPEVFVNGLAKAMRNNTYSILEKNSKNKISEKISGLEYFIPMYNGFYYVKKDGKYGIVNINGEGNYFDEILPFRCGTQREIMCLPCGYGYDCEYAIVRNNGVYGLINRKGEIIIKPEYKQMETSFYQKAIYWANKEGLFEKDWRLIDSTNRILSDGLYKSYEYKIINNEGNNRRYGMLNNKGRVIISPSKYTLLLEPCNGAVISQYMDKWGLIIFDTTKSSLANRTIKADRPIKTIDPQYDFVHCFSDETDLAKVIKKENREALINRRGLFVTEDYENITHYSDSIYTIKKKGKYGLLMMQVDSLLKHSSAQDKERYKLGNPVDSENLILPIIYDKIYFDKSDKLGTYLLDGKYGLLNERGKKVTTNKYDKISIYSDNLVVIEENQKKGIINKYGVYLVEPIMDNINLNSGIYGINGKYGIFDVQNKFFTIEASYDSVIKLESNLHSALKNNKWGLIHKGKLVLAPRMDKIHSSHKGIVTTMKDSLIGFYNTNNNILISNKYDTVYINFDNNYSIVGKNERIILIDGKGNEKFNIPRQYDPDADTTNYGISLGYFQFCVVANCESSGSGYSLPSYANNGIIKINSNGFITVRGIDYDGYCNQHRKNYWGLLNSKGKFVLLEQYDTLSDFSNKLAFGYHSQGTKQVDIIITSSDTVRIPITADSVGVISENLVWFVKEGLYGVIKDDGIITIPASYEYISDFRNGVALAKKNGKYGYINYKGQVIIPFIYDELKEWSENKIGARINKKWGFINSKGERIIDFVYDEVQNFINGKSKVRRFDENYYINEQGFFVW